MSDPTFEDDEVQWDLLSTRFHALPLNLRTAVMASHSVSGFSPKTIAIYNYIIKIVHEEDKHVNIMSVPAMLVPATLGKPYVQREYHDDYVTRVLQKTGREGVHWKFLSQQEIFAEHTSPFEKDTIFKTDIKFRTPWSNANIIFPRDVIYEQERSFAFITPRFARTLFLRDKEVGRDLKKLLIVVRKEMGMFLQAPVSEPATDPVVQPAADPVVQPADLAARREYLDLLEIEEQIAKSKMERFFAGVKDMEKIFGDSDRAFYREIGKELMGNISQNKDRNNKL